MYTVPMMNPAKSTPPEPHRIRPSSLQKAFGLLQDAVRDFLFTRRPCSPAREDRAMRQNLSERQIDKTLEDTFPASDPPAWY
ncbi:MAG: hypothetical protein SFW62_06835 [Alphaproteobacteria bacterium]|nr:hypothetical protein [Alphaproteobacteria bacterium]